MSFVQADPIRSPARAQDLILRHRVKGYRAGQLESRYPDLDIEEDILYAYGFLPRRVWQLLQPRKTTGLGALDKRVLEAVKQFGETHPRELQTHLGRRRVLQRLGWLLRGNHPDAGAIASPGLLRIARRDRGIRIYELARPHDLSLTSDERLRKLILIIAGILAPVPEKKSSIDGYPLSSLGQSSRRVGDIASNRRTGKAIRRRHCLCLAGGG